MHVKSLNGDSRGCLKLTTVTHVVLKKFKRRFVSLTKVWRVTRGCLKIATVTHEVVWSLNGDVEKRIQVPTLEVF